MLLAWGRSHRTGADGELVRWGQELARVEARVGRVTTAPEDRDTLEVALVRTASRRRPEADPRQRRDPPGGGADRPPAHGACSRRRRCSSSSGPRRSGGTPSTAWPASASPAYAAHLATYGRALQQRNGLLRLIREEQAARGDLRFWDATLLESGTAVREERHRLLEALAVPLAAAHAEIAPEEAAAEALGISYATNAPQLEGESVRDALARRLAETAEKEVWNGTTLIGPHRDDLVFELGGRSMASFASRGQQRTAILAFKLAELDLLTALDGRPPLLLLDDVFSELDPERRSHLVRRIAAPAPGVRDDHHARRPRPGPQERGHRLGRDPGRRRDRPAGPRGRRVTDRDPESPARRSRPDRIGDLLPEAARRLGLEDELRLARAIATWDAIVAERVPPAAGACRAGPPRAGRAGGRRRRADRRRGAPDAGHRAARGVRGGTRRHPRELPPADRRGRRTGCVRDPAYNPARCLRGRHAAPPGASLTP